MGKVGDMGTDSDREMRVIGTILGCPLWIELTGDSDLRNMQYTHAVAGLSQLMHNTHTAYTARISGVRRENNGT